MDARAMNREQARTSRIVRFMAGAWPLALACCGSGGSGTAPCELPVTMIADACPATFDAVLARGGCINEDYDQVGSCGAFSVYAYGHDGRVTCFYDSTTRAFAGVIFDGVPIYNTECSVTTAGRFDRSCDARTPHTVSCSADGGTD